MNRSKSSHEMDGQQLETVVAVAVAKSTTPVHDDVQQDLPTTDDHGHCFSSICLIAFHCFLSLVLNFIPCLWCCCRSWLNASAVTGNYRQVVARVRLMALTNCWFVRLNHFLGFCVLTWASVVVLGGFVSSLSEFYFRRVTMLVILQALQFGTAAAWRTFLPARRLAVPQATKNNCVHIMDTQRGNNLMRVEIPCIILLLSLSSSYNFRRPSLLAEFKQQKVISESLLVFSWLVFLNGWVAAAGIVCGRLHFYYIISPCLGDFYDSILRESMQTGLIGARKVELIDIIFEMVSEEYRQISEINVDHLTKAVGESYKDMIDYVYKHERGFEAALMATESQDKHVQEAAMHMVGFWVEREALFWKSKLLRFEGALTRSLIRVALGGTGRAARAAVGSLHKLAQHDPLAILAAQKDTAAMLAQRVVDLVDLGEHLRFAKRHQLLPVLIKALVALLEYKSSCSSSSAYSCVLHCLTKEQKEELEGRLLTAFQSEGSSKRLQAVAGYALHSTLHSEAFTNTILKEHLMAGNACPRVSEDILCDEHDEYLIRYLAGIVPLEWDSNSVLTILPRDGAGQADPGSETCGSTLIYRAMAIILPLLLEFGGVVAMVLIPTYF